eukprot:m.183864 g.183864  ORF g.183864 m.183864 type:complete len:182 (-) comp18088_c0_seq1:5051-5596(-)
MAWLGDALRRVVRHGDYTVEHDEAAADRSGLRRTPFDSELARLSRRGRLKPALLCHLWQDLNLTQEQFHGLYLLLFEAGICFALERDGSDLAVAPLITQFDHHDKKKQRGPSRARSARGPRTTGLEQSGEGKQPLLPAVYHPRGRRSPPCSFSRAARGAHLCQAFCKPPVCCVPSTGIDLR